MNVGELISILSDFAMETPIAFVTTTVDGGKTGVHAVSPRICVYPGPSGVTIKAES